MTTPEYNAEQLAANELRSNAVTREEKDIAAAALKAAFPGLKPGVAQFDDGEKIM
jgi:hypothetical protein